MRAMFDLLLAGGRPDLETLIEVFGEAVPSLRRLKDTPQDPEWHAEGDVHTHTAMVLAELYRELDSPAGAALPAGAANPGPCRAFSRPGQAVDHPRDGGPRRDARHRAPP